jgi:hypothetical protein
VSAAARICQQHLVTGVEGACFNVAREADLRSWRSNISATGRPARAAAARSSALRLTRSSELPCEQLSLAQSNPAAISSSSRPSVDGPSVATIFVRLSGAMRVGDLVQACSGSLIAIVEPTFQIRPRAFSSNCTPQQKAKPAPALPPLLRRLRPLLIR